MSLKISICAACLLTATALRALAAEIVGYWALTNGPESSLSSEADGVLYGGAEFVDGAVSLDGETGFVLLDPAPALQPTTGGMFYAIWLKWESEAARPMRVLGRFKAAGDERGYSLLLVDNRAFVFFSSDGSAGEAVLKASVDPIRTTGQWQHIAIVFDSSRHADPISLYVDSVRVDLLAIQAPDVLSVHDAAAALVVGTYGVEINDEGATGATNCFRGSLSQFVLGRGAASWEQVGALYRLGRNAAAAEVLRCFREEEAESADGDPPVSSSLDLPPPPAPSGGPEPGGRPDTIYVDMSGDDSFDGAHRAVVDRANGIGPKRTIQAGLRAGSAAGCQVHVNPGVYVEGPIVMPSGTRVVFEGRVELH